MARERPGPGMRSVDVLAELVGGILAVGGGAALEQGATFEHVLLRTRRLERVDGEQVAELGRRSRLRPQATPARKPARNASPGRRSGPSAGRPGRRATSTGCSPSWSTRVPSPPRVVTRTPTWLVTSAAVQPVLCSVSDASYSLLNRYAAPVDAAPGSARRPDGELLRRVGRERDLLVPALLGETQHGVPGRRRRSGPGRRGPRGRTRSRSDVLAHGARVERRDLVQVGVGGADEPRGVELGGLAHRRWCPRRGPPASAGSRRSRCRPCRPAAAGARGSRDRTRCWPPPRRGGSRGVDTRNDSEILSSLSAHELVGEPAGEGHQVVGRDRTGHSNAHRAAPSRSANW